jgi:ferric-dicitrate binding protein FerR (iron transport regulator)
MNQFLLKRYYDDTCTPEERRQVELWLMENQDKPEVDQLLQDIWTNTETLKPLAAQNFDKLLEEIRQSIVSNDTQSGSRSSYLRPALGIAASISLIIIAIFSYRTFFNPYHTVKTGYSETREIVLPDHSTVKLNSNSTLRYKKDFLQEKEREVWLEGEAFFDVVHLKNNRKFFVKTQHLHIEVLGTSFNVKGRKDKTKIVLNSGKVKLNVNTGNYLEQVFMNPGELVEFDDSRKTLTRKEVDAEVYTSWRNNLLTFNQIPLKEIATIIRETFGKEVVFESDSIAGMTFTGSNPANDLELLLQTLSVSFKLDIEEQDDQIVIKSLP